jgi:copper chaperone CopZ
MENQRETVLNVPGMSCGSCVSHVGEALRELEGVAKVDVQLCEGKVIVQHDPRSAPIELMVDTLRDAGYDSAPA